MDKRDFSGIEVSAGELIVAVERARADGSPGVFCQRRPRPSSRASLLAGCGSSGSRVYGIHRGLRPGSGSGPGASGDRSDGRQSARGASFRHGHDATQQE